MTPRVSHIDYVVVSSDAAAFERSELARESIETTRQLGFSELGWVAMTMDGKAGLVSYAGVTPDATTVVALTHFGGKDTIALKSVLEDGTIITTEQVPAGWVGWVSAYGVAMVTSRKELKYDHAATTLTDMGAMLAKHRERVAKYGPAAKTVPIDMRVYIATRRRWREISEPERIAREKLYMPCGLAGMVLAAVAMGFLSHALHPILLEKLGADVAKLVSVVLGIVGLFVCIGVSSVTAIAGATLTAVFFRNLPVPPARPAHELARLGDFTREGPVPESFDVAQERAQSANGEVRVATTNLKGLLRRDLAIRTSSAAAYVLVGIALTLVLGQGAIPATVGMFFCLDGLLLLIHGEGRLQILRTRFVPELVIAEAKAQGACTAGAGGGARRPIAALMILIGAAMLFVAKRSLGAPPGETVTATLLTWTLIGVLLIVMSWRSTKKQHARVTAA